MNAEVLKTKVLLDEGDVFAPKPGETILWARGDMDLYTRLHWDSILGQWRLAETAKELKAGLICFLDKVPPMDAWIELIYVAANGRFVRAVVYFDKGGRDEAVR